MVESIDKKLAVLEASAGLDTAQRAPRGAGSAICAILRREVAAQYKFMLIFQSLLAMIGVFVAVAVVYAVLQAIDGNSIEALVSALAALVSGAATKFLIDQRKDAREWFEAAKAGIEKHHCPDA